MPYIPDNPPENVVFNQFDGLKNTVAAERLGPTDLERAVNVDIDDAKQIRRRRGYMRKLTGKFHSAYSVPRGLLVARDGHLTLVYDSYEAVDLGAEVGDDPLSYVHIGIETYFSSRSASGIVKHDLTVEPWGAEVSPGEWVSPVMNPTATLGAVRGKLLGKPPMATSLTLYNGRIFLANEKVLWFTEPYLYNYINKTRNFFQYEYDITALGVVANGIYVGTEGGLYFQSGDVSKMERLKVSSAPVLARSIVPVDPDVIGAAQQAQSKQALMCMTGDGIVACLDSGVTFNLTQDRFVFPEAIGAAPLFRRQDGMNQYIVVTDSGGSPSSSACIGDYVEAEIRRFRS